MKRINVLLCVAVLMAGFVGIPAKAFGNGGDKLDKVIKVAPNAPAFSVDQRQAELAKRRAKVAERLEDNSILILFSADSKIYTNDVSYPFRQENNHYYLTALKQKGSTFVMIKENGKVREAVFLPVRNPRFETWNGRLYSAEDATRLSGIKTIVSAREQKAFLESVKSKTAFAAKDGTFRNTLIPEHVYLLNGRGVEYQKEANFAKELKSVGADAGSRVKNATGLFAALRLEKSPYEIKIMQHSVDITNEAIMRAMKMVGRAKWEYEVQAEIEYTFRRRNADFWGFPSIVACGANATTLHYETPQAPVKPGDLMLMDVGAEYDHYTADITRTFPVNGKFTKPQAEIYQIVYDAQEAAAAALKPGATVADASRAAREVIVNGLFKLGLITDKKSNQSRIWYMHGWGHWIGMNVHDVGNYGTRLKEGMMMSNEPGIYIRGDALDYLPDTPANREFIAKVKPAYEKYKNIGVRIEDDMLITSTGVRWMSKDLPRSISNIERFMAGKSKEVAVK